MPSLAKRILVAMVGIPILVMSAVWGKNWILSVAILVQFIALLEWRSLVREIAPSLSPLTLVFGMIGVDLFLMGYGNPTLSAIGLVAIGIWLCSEVFRLKHSPIKNLSVGSFFLLYVCIPLALWTRFSSFEDPLRFSAAGPLVSLFVSTWFCDSGAFFVGKALGRRKLYLEASPNKTVEGAIGGLFCAALPLPIAVAMHWAQPTLSDMIILPLIVGVFGQTGDLLESLIKREAGVKDTSSLLPGHGGFLDRFDSLLVSTPFFFAYLLVTSH